MENIRAMRHVLCSAVLVLLSASSSAVAQERPVVYAGGVFGVSTLSADATSSMTAADVRASLYKPENGPAISGFAGVHLGSFIAVQGSYVWNRNDVTLLSSVTTPTGGTFYEQRRTSTQQLAIVDALVYVRRRDSRVRPYLSAGVGIQRFTSEPLENVHVNGIAPPPERGPSTRGVLHVAVGIDIRIASRSRFRYSYGETLSGNPVSADLMPMAPRKLANFHNLFGWVWDL
jgi:hypothetical protein